MSAALSLAYQHAQSVSIALHRHALASVAPSERLRNAAMQQEEVLHALYLELVGVAALRDAPSGLGDADDIHAAV